MIEPIPCDQKLIRIRNHTCDISQGIESAHFGIPKSKFETFPGAFRLTRLTLACFGLETPDCHISLDRG